MSLSCAILLLKVYFICLLMCVSMHTSTQYSLHILSLHFLWFLTTTFPYVCLPHIYSFVLWFYNPHIFFYWGCLCSHEFVTVYWRMVRNILYSICKYTHTLSAHTDTYIKQKYSLWIYTYFCLITFNAFLFFYPSQLCTVPFKGFLLAHWGV